MQLLDQAIAAWNPCTVGEAAVPERNWILKNWKLLMVAASLICASPAATLRCCVVQVNCRLQRLALAAFPCQFPPEALAALQTSLASSRPRLRAAVLAASHPRLGAASPLARLPRELLAALLARAVPPEGCSLALELPQGLAGDSSSDDSSSDDSSSSEDSDDSDDEDSSSSGSQEGN